MAQENLAPAAPEAPEQTEELSLRDQLDAAFTEDATDEVPEPSQQGQEMVPARSRDELGRYATEKAPVAPQETRQAVPQGVRGAQGARAPQGAPATQPRPEDRPPQSWTAAGRETWAALPPAARAEIYRRESEMGRVLQEGAGNRQFIDAFTRVVAPYEMFIRAENSNPLQAMQSLFQTAAELRVGTPGSKAALVAGLINDYAVDINLLDTLLAQRGNIAQVRSGNIQQQPQAFRDPRVDQLLAMQQQQAQAQQAYEEREIRSGLDGFANTHEFYRDVAGLMADIVDVRAAQRQPIDIEKIYAQACQMHEGVSQVVAQRRQTPRGTPRQAVLRARRAAVSVSGDSTPSGGATIPEDDSIRGLLEAAMDRTQ